MLSTMVENLLNSFSNKERTIIPETMPQALDQPDERVSPPTGRICGKSNHSFKSVLPTFEDNLSLKEVVSLLTNTYKQLASKTIQDCIKDGFPSSFLHCQNPQALESSINVNNSKSEPKRIYSQATYDLGPILFPLL